MREFENYHIHSDETNIFFTDSPVKKRDYADRAVELGGRTLSTCEHGFAGNFLATYDIAKSRGLKMVFAAELYWVKDRLEKDKTNCHIILMARNESGRRQINRLISEANDTGFYNRPRVDLPLLLSLNPADVVVTTACIAFYGYGMQESEQIILRMHQHFGPSLFVEVQAHPIEKQRDVNRLALRLYRKHGIRLIAACDSHFIRPEQAQDRNDMQYGIFTEADEDGEGSLYMDYPDGDELFRRFVAQGVLPEAVIEEAIANTLIVREFEEFSFDSSRKIPNPYPSLSKEERDKLYLKLVDEAWQAYRVHVPEERWPQYEEAIRYETDTVVGGGIADYFLLDKRIVDEGVERGGIITQSGRGSGPSFFTNSLLGFSSMDRVALPVKMFPDRFVSKPRLVAGQLPDLDLNVADRTPFIEAQKAILGAEHAYPMIAYGTMKKKAAWKMYCRAANQSGDVISQEAMQEISDALGRYDMACKEADEDEEIDISEYVPDRYMDLYRKSESYGGIISGKTVHPCAILIYDGNIREEIGLVRAKSRSGKNDELVTVIDGVTADKYGYVKNDLLRVAVWELIDAIYKKIGIPIPTTNELLSWVTEDPETWKVFAKGWCCGVNQCEKPKTKERLMRYKPQNITELSAFVAAIRPGFKSNLELFLSRKPFSYGIPEFDAIIQTEQMKNSFLLYQENIMAALQYAGFPPTESYVVLKHIAKKHPDKIAEIKPLFIDGFSAKVGQETAEMVWQIINDASSYSFNACLPGDQVLYSDKQRYARPSIGEMYRTLHDKAWAEANGHIDLHHKYKYYGYGSAFSMYEDGRIRQNKIVDIRDAGMATVYTVTLEDGRTIRCTANHKFPTPNGKKRLDELTVGDELYVRGEYDKSVDEDAVRWRRKAEHRTNLPRKGQRGFQRLDINRAQAFHVVRQEYIDAQSPCSVCGCEYSVDACFELHHVDHNRANNVRENLQWLCNSCHKRTHYGEGRRRRYEKGISTNLVPIASIVEDGMEQVYDVEMAAPAHNFVVSSGIVTSNSHSTAVAFDALYVAWAKAHHPLETYHAMLETYSKKASDKERLILIEGEMLTAYGVRIAPIRYGEDNTGYIADPGKNAISDALYGIPYMNRTVASELARAPQMDTFTDVLRWLHEDTHVNARQAMILIRLGYFERFGSIGKLTSLFIAFNEGPDKYRKTYVDKTKQARLTALRALEASMEDTPQSPYELASNQVAILGHPQGTFSTDPEDYIVTEVEERYSPKIHLYSLARGTSGVLKMLKSFYNSRPLKPGDCIRIPRTGWEKKPKVAFKDGKKTKVPGVYERWIINYTALFIAPEEKEKTA